MVCEAPGGALGQRALERVRNAGYRAQMTGLESLARDGQLQSAKPDLLLLCDASRLPFDSVGPIHQFLKDGGDLIALNTPMWRTLLLRDEDKWSERDAFITHHEAEIMQHALFDFTEGIDGWQRTTNDGQIPASYGIVPDARALKGNALHAVINRVTGWDTFVSPQLAQPFSEGREFTIVLAKGSPSTAPQLAIEWRENDGSRLMARSRERRLEDVSWRRIFIIGRAIPPGEDHSTPGRGADRRRLGALAPHWTRPQ